MTNLSHAPRVVVAFCTFNRSARLPALVAALREQRCDEPFALLVIDNNSTDETQDVLQRLIAQTGPLLRCVKETTQGIVPARNRLLAEAAHATFVLMLDDDELPTPGWVQAGLSALRDEGCECVGGRVRVKFEPGTRPAWLTDDLLGFLAEVNHGDQPFVIRDDSTPIWTANVGYRTSLFSGGLRFDSRYSRVGKAIGGGEDVMMLEKLLSLGCRIGYRPGMVVEHFVETWRLRRRYFLQVHFTSGFRAGLHATDVSGRTLLGVPLYLFPQALRQGWRTLLAATTGQRRWIRQGMNFTYACGRIVGTRRRARLPPASPLNA